MAIQVKNITYALEGFMASLDIKLLILRIINFLLYYGGWFICVKEAAYGNPIAGTIMIGIVLIYNLIISKAPLVDAILILTVSLLGTIIDTTYVLTNVIVFKSTYANWPWLAPMWITVLWGLFATTLNNSLYFLKKYWWLTFPGGAITGAATYAFIVELDAAVFPVSKQFSLITIGLVWALVFPLCFLYAKWLSSKLNRGS